MATINFDGAYSSLSGLPTIPSNNNQLTNGAGYITGITSSMVTTALGFTPYSNSNPSGFTSFDGAYSSLTGKPTIPTNTNQLTNGNNFVSSGVM